MTQKQIEAGTLTKAELDAFTKARANAAQLLQQIGGLEIQKARLMDQINDTEAEAQKVLTEARVRLGIPEDAPWRIQSDGKIFTVAEVTED